MIGQLVEYHNPSTNQRWGIIKEKIDSNTFNIATDWQSYLSDKGRTRKSSLTAFKILSLQEIQEKASSIEDYFFWCWGNHNKNVRTVHFKLGEQETSIDNLPPWAAEMIADSFLAQGFFAYTV
jgi:hypothetical protein